MTLVPPTIARLWPAATLGILAAITVLSLIPLPEDHGTGDYLESDKVQHLIAYGAAALPAALVRPRHWWLVLAVVALWGGLVELAQPLVGREANWADFAANAGGVGLGGLAGHLLRRALGGLLRA